MVDLDLLHDAPSVVRALPDGDHVKALLEQCDGRQDPAAVQAIRVQIVGFEIGRRDKTDPLLEQGAEQAVQDHGVGDVGHMELVEADQPVLARHLPGEHVQRVDRALQQGQLAVHLPHELVEMQARLALHGDGPEEAVHQETLAAAHATVHVHAAGDLRTVDQLLEGARTLAPVVRPIGRTAVQRRDNGELPGIRLVGPQLELALVRRQDRGHRHPPSDGKITARGP